MPRTATLQNTNYSDDLQTNGRENIVLETIVILLALIMIISGFSLYVGNAFAASSDIHQASVSTTEKPLSLAEI